MIRNLFRSMSLSFGFVMIFLLVIASSIVFQTTFAQTPNDDVAVSEQTTLSEELANNPVAQDILKKIEQTKKWIEELEQRNYEKLETQKELEEKRQQALTKLNQDLKDWHNIWDYYSPRNSFERFVEKIPDSQVQGVFWDQFEFKEQKVKAGRDALKKVIADGGSLHQARQAYVDAAETKRIELIEANSQFNVRHKLAYYNQQILFDREGQFVDSPITGEQLRKYYEDFRTNPAYLDANPNDDKSWDEFGRTNANTECIEGKIVVYRLHARDYVCVTMSTAELWIQHGMGEITGDSDEINTQFQQYVSPLTKCDEEFRVVFNTETGKYSCILENTANEWIEQGIAEFHDPEEYIMKSIERKETLVKIEEINQKFIEIENDLEVEKISLKKKYDIKYNQTQAKSNETQKEAIMLYNDSEMSKEEISKKISSIRKQYDSEKEEILSEKIKETKELEKKYEQKMETFAQTYDLDPYIKIISKSGMTGYKAVLRE